MTKFKETLARLWQIAYVKPKNWLCSRETDKVLHFTVSMILVLFLAVVVRLWMAAAITFAIGILKEVLIDKLIMKEQVDMEDIKADFHGTVCGILLVVVLYLVFQLFNQ